MLWPLGVDRGYFLCSLILSWSEAGPRASTVRAAPQVLRSGTVLCENTLWRTSTTAGLVGLVGCEWTVFVVVDTNPNPEWVALFHLALPSRTWLMRLQSRRACLIYISSQQERQWCFFSMLCYQEVPSWPWPNSISYFCSMFSSITTYYSEGMVNRGSPSYSPLTPTGDGLFSATLIHQLFHNPTICWTPPLLLTPFTSRKYIYKGIKYILYMYSINMCSTGLKIYPLILQSSMAGSKYPAVHHRGNIAGQRYCFDDGWIMNGWVRCVMKPELWCFTGCNNSKLGPMQTPAQQGAPALSRLSQLTDWDRFIPPFWWEDGVMNYTNECDAGWRRQDDARWHGELEQHW